jgi:hypothetical protein
LDNPNNNENDRKADDMHDTDISDDDLDLIDQAEQPDILAAPNITGCIRPVRKIICTPTLLVMNSTPVNSQATRTGKGNKQQ